MSIEKVYPVPASMGLAHVNKAEYQSQYLSSIDNSDEFWAEKASEYLDWYQPWDKVQDCDFLTGKVRWFEGAQLNVSYNCLDRHLHTRGDQTAIIWEGDNPKDSTSYSYKELHEAVCRFSNAMRARGIRKGDRVAIYMPMVVEATVAMLACARIGAVHSVVFGGFSPTALKDRILDSECCAVITTDEGVRGGRIIPLKNNVDEALQDCDCVKSVFVVRRTGGEVSCTEGRDLWWHEVCASASPECEPEPMDSEDPLFILYTSGSTGTPKGVLHTTAGYLLFAAITHKLVFDYREGEVYWCTADVGWVTGHTYIVYGPLANGATSLMFEGVPTYPDAGRFWDIVSKHEVNSFYTAPTAIRALMSQGDKFVTRSQRSSLRILGTVGEPINPEAWKWYHEIVGDSRCPIVDTWWQTETGGHLIAPLPGATELKPGSATLPFFGVQPALLDEQGSEIEGNPAEGALVIKRSWPGQMRTIYGDHQRFMDTYLNMYPGYYFSGDGARRDEDGYYWITGRMDDVLNVSGHRMGTAEIESALVSHNAVAEAAVVGYPHMIKGEGVYAYVTLMAGAEATGALRDALVAHVRSVIGSIASPDIIQWAPGLPKTRSGKIMRRILRKIASNELDNLGDTSTLADPSVVEELIEQRVNR